MQALALAFSLLSCAARPVEGAIGGQVPDQVLTTDSLAPIILPGIFRIDSLSHHLKGRNVAIVANHTARINSVHLVDTLISLNVNIVKIFAPEHGFRGEAADGENIANTKDVRTGLPVISLYGKTKKPTPASLKGVDVILFDIQDVGARFYTFLSTMHYVMEAAAENSVSLIVLDRPNPNGFYVDGPLLKKGFHSFVGMHPIPVVHGMTLGELALMINAQGWLANGSKCQLSIVKCQNYTHSSLYQLPIRPSPNLPNMMAIYLYPSLCFFEGTNVSVGRGTEAPFTRVGDPHNESGDFTFIPHSIKGVSEHPPHEGMECRGYNLQDSVKLAQPPDSLQLFWLEKMYNESTVKGDFFLPSEFINLLYGSNQLKNDILAGKTAAEIQTAWKSELDEFKMLRKQFLLYPDFKTEN